ARRHHVPYIKRGGALLAARGIGILRGSGLPRAVGKTLQLADNSTRVIERFGKCVIGLKTNAEAGRSLLNASLQRMIGGVGPVGDDLLGTEAAGDGSRGVEFRVRGEACFGSSISIRKGDCGQADADSCHIGCSHFYVSQILVESSR